ncbi:MAG: class I adenylate-forming enzyme family protein [Hyphomicrobiaceae bacterium]
MFELLCEQAATAPERAIAITADASVSYASLEERVRNAAKRMYEAGVRRGDRVGLLCDNRVEWLEVFFAAAALGAIVVPFSTWSTARELDFLLSDAGVRMLFSIPRFGDRDFVGDISALRSAAAHRGLEKVVLIGASPREGFETYSTYSEGEMRPSLPPGEGASAADPAVILYTSGSSNRPKAVPLDHFGIIENGFNIGERQGLVPGDRVLVSVPLFWSYGAVNALPATVTHGATLVMQGHFEAGGALDLIEQERCTAIYALPAMTNALVAHPAFHRSRTASLRAGVTIGAPQDVMKAAQQLGASQICNIYGATENYGNCCVTPHHWPLEARATCQGIPLPGVQLRIRDPEASCDVRPGEIGEIEVRGYLTKGYLGDSAQFNASVFTSDGYFRTGDLGSLRQDGTLQYAGRNSEMIKRSGINVAPAEVEEVLQQHPSVALAGVTGLADAAKGELIVAYLTARPGSSIDVESIIDHSRKLLSRYKVPDRVYVCEALPLTSTGKLLRRELKAIAARTTAT